MSQAAYDWSAWDEEPERAWDIWSAVVVTGVAAVYLGSLLAVGLAGGGVTTGARWILVIIAILLGIGAITVVAVVWSTRRVNTLTGTRAAQLHHESVATRDQLLAAIDGLVVALAQARQEVDALRAEVAAMQKGALQAGYEMRVEYERRNRNGNGSVRDIGRQTRD